MGCDWLKIYSQYFDPRLTDVLYRYKNKVLFSYKFLCLLIENVLSHG